MSKKGSVWVLVFLMVPLVMAGLGSGPCFSGGVEQVSACYDSSLDSGLGFGAVELCNDCYRCGDADGVCPEDFSDGTNSASCGSCPDPDCAVTLTGKILEQSGNLGIRNAQVSAQLLHVTDWQTNPSLTTTADDFGNYVLDVPRGNYQIKASAQGYESRLASFPISQPGPDEYYLNITLANGTCHTDCTGYHYDGEIPRCSASCHEFGTTINDRCLFDSDTFILGATSYDVDAREYCDGVPIGATRTIMVNPLNPDESLVVECCSQQFKMITRPKVTFNTATSTVKNLVVKSYSFPSSTEGSPVKLKLIIYNE